ncbi:hypothetical protein BGZ65_009566, partial [Modicella reniformis]
ALNPGVAGCDVVAGVRASIGVGDSGGDGEVGFRVMRAWLLVLALVLAFAFSLVMALVLVFAFSLEGVYINAPIPQKEL